MNLFVIIYLISKALLSLYDFIDIFMMFNSAKITINTKLSRELVTFNNHILYMFQSNKILIL